MQVVYSDSHHGDLMGLTNMVAVRVTIGTFVAILWSSRRPGNNSSWLSCPLTGKHHYIGRLPQGGQPDCGHVCIVAVLT